jgi:hypothetical protein
MDNKREIPIWFFIGALLLVYGVLILGVGIYHLFSPPQPAVKLANLHADIWWSLLLLAIGLLYTVKYWPFRAAVPSRAEKGLPKGAATPAD